MHRIRAIMAEREISQSELARRVGVSQQTIFKLTHGISQNSRFLHKVARELGTTPAYLTGETDDPDEDAPAAPEMTSDEAELLQLYRALEPKDRAALAQLARTIATSAHSPTMHEPGKTFRAGAGQ
ncbi:helix-turn-helix domain-containing protein [Sphingomonas sp. IW22]|uniref:helix-turn-helix domain-containing protein n=1 Tax=Sphingomonas sp. IW22 TaxID=3242489 RepID=UPI003522D761